MLATLRNHFLFGLTRWTFLLWLRIQILCFRTVLVIWKTQNYFGFRRISLRATGRASTRVQLYPKDLLEAGLLNGFSTSTPISSRRPIGEDTWKGCLHPENYLAVHTDTGKMVFLSPTLISLIYGDSSISGMWMIPTRGAGPFSTRLVGTPVITITLS